jgi:amino acid adenylation domain-containing protein
MSCWPSTLIDLVTSAAREHGNRPALLAPGRLALDYAGLLDLVRSTSGVLAGAGIAPGQRVAVVTANGPEAASAFLAIAACAACAPLNPSYREEEFRFYLSDLRPSALIVEEGLDCPAGAVAIHQGIPVISLRRRQDAPAGWFELSSSGPVTNPTFAKEENVSLVLHTSGTTSRPKVVPLTSRNLCRSAHNIAGTLALSADDRCLNVMPLFHIHGLAAAVLASLSCGASVVCAPGFVAPRFFEWMDAFRPTWYTAVPTMHQSILQRSLRHADIIERAPLRFIRSSSAPLPPQAMRDLESVFGVPVIEAYGMTEAAHQMASNPLPPAARKPGSVGRAAGPEVAVMDDAGNLLPAGTIGEVVIQGENVTRGYDDNPQANTAAFTNGWFRTGDQGRFDEEGYLFLTGRLKEIINRGGEKISPREVDEVLMDHPMVAQALAFAIPDPKLGEEVAAAVVLRDGASLDEAALQYFAQQRLSDFKIPRHIVFLKEIPKGATGKLQRIGLAAKLAVDNAIAITPPAPQLGEADAETALERKLAAIWAKVLGLDRVSANQNFFDIGGDSLLALQVASRLRDAGIELTVVDMFRQPTVNRMARWLSQGGRSCDPARGVIPRVDREQGQQLSFAQERMFFLDQYEEEKAVYNRPALFRLHGAVSVSALEQSLRATAERHETLRTTYQLKDGELRAVVLAPAAVPVRIVEAGSLEEALAAVREEAREAFDLSRDLMFRASLYRLGADDWLFSITMHHIASDGWSSRLFLSEMAEVYRACIAGEEPKLDPLPIRYADFSAWQRERLTGERLDYLLEYWRAQLADAPSLLELPTDHPRPTLQQFSSARLTAILPKELAGGLTKLAREHDVTLFMVLLAAFQSLLARYSGMRDIVVGTPVAGRTRTEMEPLIGLFVNTLPLRTNLDGDPTFKEILGRVRDTTLEAFSHQELPFEKLVDGLSVARSVRHAPVFQVMFQLRNVPHEPAELAGCEMAEIDVDPGVQAFDLNLEVGERDGALRCDLGYRTDLFEAPTAERMLSHLRNLLAGVVQNPSTRFSELALLDEAERRQLIDGVNPPLEPLPEPWLHRKIDQLAQTRPHQLAVVCGAAQLTYGSLKAVSDRIARRLLECGVGVEDVVAVVSGRSMLLPAAVLGIWKVGAAYAPLDPAFPTARLEFILRDSRARAIVVERAAVKTLPAHSLPVIVMDEIAPADPCEDPPPVGTTADTLAYVIYTSGSTGQPKGVEVMHGGLSNVIGSFARLLEVDHGDVSVDVSTPSFDLSAFNLFLPLSSGAKLVMGTGEDAKDGERLGALLASCGATIVAATPTTWTMLIETGWAGLPRLKAISCGETLSRELAAALLGRTRELWNMYGPTEVSVAATAYRVEPGEGPAPIGRPVANTRCYILDDYRQLVPAGCVGELYVGGAGVAHGYCNRPELTAERFLPDPFAGRPGARMYRTGDRARFRSDGAIEFFGRLDCQVKLRGHRIELGEVEAALRRHPSVTDCAVVLQTAPDGSSCLAAFLAPSKAGPATPEVLRQFLRQTLPDYMIPAAFTYLENLPLSSNGKVDRRTLAQRPPAAIEPAPIADRSLSPVEAIVAAAFHRLLNWPRIGPDDNFFDLGGHSLMAMRLQAHLRQELGIELPLRQIFSAPTVRSIARMSVEAMLAQELVKERGVKA